jgi:hypothetical protein
MRLLCKTSYSSGVWVHCEESGAADSCPDYPTHGRPCYGRPCHRQSESKESVPHSVVCRGSVLPDLLVEYFWAKNGPRFNGGQVALVLSRCESFIGGLTAGWPLALKQSLGGGWPRSYGCSAPAAAEALWGDAPAGAAKLFSIKTRCTLLILTRSGF